MVSIKTILTNYPDLPRQSEPIISKPTNPLGQKIFIIGLKYAGKKARRVFIGLN